MFAATIARQSKTIRDLTRLVRQQAGRIRVVERDREEAWQLVADLQLELDDLRSERAALLERCPSDARFFDQEAGA